MKIEALSSNALYNFLKSVLPYYTFKLYMHILTEPYITLLTELPLPVKRTSEVYLDGEKEQLNNYAIKRLRSAGYKRVWYVRRLHTKLILIGSRPDYVVVGTANLTSRSFSQYEVVLVVRNPPKKVVEDIYHILVKPAEEYRYAPTMK